MNRQQFVATLRPGLRKDMRDNYMSFEKEWPSVVRTGTMDRAEIDLFTMSGVHRQVELGEREPYVVMDPVAGQKITKTDTQFGNAISISKNYMEDDLYGKARKSAQWLGRSVALIQEYTVADFLDDAFAGATYTGMEGEVLCSTSHSLLNSANTWSNQISGNPTLGVTSLQAAFELGESTVDQQGDPIPVRIDYLIVNLSNEWMAMQLTQNQQEPFTADRNINTIVRKRKLGYTVNHYKDQTGKDWFARDTQMHDAWLAWKVRPEFPDWYDDMTRSAYFAARQRFLVYFFDQRGWIGSNAT